MLSKLETTMEVEKKIGLFLYVSWIKYLENTIKYKWK